MKKIIVNKKSLLLVAAVFAFSVFVESAVAVIAYPTAVWGIISPPRQTGDTFGWDQSPNIYIDAGYPAVYLITVDAVWTSPSQDIYQRPDTGSLNPNSFGLQSYYDSPGWWAVRESGVWTVDIHVDGYQPANPVPVVSEDLRVPFTVKANNTVPEPSASISCLVLALLVLSGIGRHMRSARQ